MWEWCLMGQLVMMELGYTEQTQNRQNISATMVAGYCTLIHECDVSIMFSQSVEV